MAAREGTLHGDPGPRASRAEAAIEAQGLRKTKPSPKGSDTDIWRKKKTVQILSLGGKNGCEGYTVLLMVN